MFGSTGFVYAKNIACLTLGGSLIAGTENATGRFELTGGIAADNALGTVLIKGSVIGNPINPVIISAGGSARPTAISDVAIGRLTVLGGLAFARILAGVRAGFMPVDADAQIGAVTVGGDWIASSLAAGAVPGANGFYGDGDDAKMSGPGVKDESKVFSKISSVSIGGRILGSAGGTDHYGIVAERIGAGPVDGTMLHLHPGPHNDDLSIGVTGDFAVHEI
jgi:hypothetical protein